MGDRRYRTLDEHDKEIEGWNDLKQYTEKGWTFGGKKLGLVALLLSVMTLSVYVVVTGHSEPAWVQAARLPSRYAGLQRNVPSPILRDSDFQSTNRTIQDAAWSRPEMRPEIGFITLDDAEATSMGLPHSQRWPWDASKGVYILQSTHQLHCLHALREVLNDAHDDLPAPQRRYSHAHAIHCLDVLRMSVQCDADDFPLYTGRVNANAAPGVAPKAGTGSVRMCRDWAALGKWASERSACYKPRWGEGGHGHVEEEVERYKFCPDGARPWEGVQ